MTARRPDPVPAVSRSTFAERAAAPPPPGRPRARRIADDEGDAPTVFAVASTSDIVHRIES